MLSHSGVPLSKLDVVRYLQIYQDINQIKTILYRFVKVNVEVLRYRVGRTALTANIDSKKV